MDCVRNIKKGNEVTYALTSDRGEMENGRRNRVGPTLNRKG